VTTREELLALASERASESGLALLSQHFADGTKIEYGGRKWSVGALGNTGGERYVWLSRKGETAMLPVSLFSARASIQEEKAP
jgi:hypothetical protein